MKTPVKNSKRSLYKAAEVCDLAGLQPYVLSTWEAEFPSLGVVQSNGKNRVYRRVDVDTVLRLKELIVSEGLTLGAARRRLLKETPALDGGDAVPFETVLEGTRARVEGVKAGLRGILELLSQSRNGAPGGSDAATEGGDSGSEVVDQPKVARVPRTSAARRKSGARKRA